jgi:glycosyltransferase involved in cell wall biosynthesis
VRVLVVGPSAALLGGIARCVADHRARLAQEPSVRVDFVPVDPRGGRLLGLARRVRYLRTLVTTLRYCALIVRRVPRSDVVHLFSASQTSFVLASTPAILLGRLFGRPVIVHYHCGDAADHLARWRRTAIPTLRLVRAIVVPSGFLVRELARFGLRARAIPNLLEVGAFPFRERAPLRPVFLASRLLEPSYGVDCVLRAFARIQERIPDARLVVAGDGSLRASLERLARTLGLRHVRFVGRVPMDEMAGLYDAADVYLTATRVDNAPNSILEALACGLAVVTTDAGGIPDLVRHEDTCLMVPCGDPEAMADAAGRLLGDPVLAQRLGQRGREHAERFGWRVVGPAWLALYRRLASGGSGETTPGGPSRLAGHPRRTPNRSTGPLQGRAAPRPFVTAECARPTTTDNPTSDFHAYSPG